MAVNGREEMARESWCRVKRPSACAVTDGVSQRLSRVVKVEKKRRRVGKRHRYGNKTAIGLCNAARLFHWSGLPTYSWRTGWQLTMQCCMLRGCDTRSKLSQNMQSRTSQTSVFDRRLALPKDDRRSVPESKKGFNQSKKSPNAAKTISKNSRQGYY